MTETTFQRQLDWLDEEANSAMTVYDMYEELNRLHERGYIHRALLADAAFWQVQKASLQHMLFAILGRIFDKRGDAHSVAKVLNNARKNLQFFSHEALARRKTAGAAVKPEWMDGYMEWLDDDMADAWIPDAQAFTDLEEELESRQAEFNKTYLPIRNSYYAHRALKPLSIEGLFAQTNRAELGKMLVFLRDLGGALREAFYNGNPPVLGKLDCESDRREIRSAVRGVLGKLVLCSLSRS